MNTYTTFSSKTLGGLVVEKISICGTHRGVLRANGTAVVYFKSKDGAKFLVSSTGKKAANWTREMMGEAKASLN